MEFRMVAERSRWGAATATCRGCAPPTVKWETKILFLDSFLDLENEKH